MRKYSSGLCSFRSILILGYGAPWCKAHFSMKPQKSLLKLQPGNTLLFLFHYHFNALTVCTKTSRKFSSFVKRLKRCIQSNTAIDSWFPIRGGKKHQTPYFLRIIYPLKGHPLVLLKTFNTQMVYKLLGTCRQCVLMLKETENSRGLVFFRF